MHQRSSVAFFVLIFLFLSCKKDPLQQYEGNFRIRVPIIHPSTAYIVASGDSTQLYMSTQGTQTWKISRVGGQSFTISVAENPARVFHISNGGGMELAVLSPMTPDTRAYFTIEQTKNQMVAFHSVYSGKYIYVPYCEKNGEAWAYDINTVSDLTTCNAMSAGADTCYCVSSFALERQ